MPRASITLILLLCLPLWLPASAARAKGQLAEPDEGPDPRGVTVHASDVAAVARPATPNDTTIGAAVAKARERALGKAVTQSRQRAAVLAKAAGLTIGELVAIRERNPSGDENIFFPMRYCFRSRPPGRSCRTPKLAAASITATFATLETTAAVGAGRAVTAAGAASAPVTPLKRRDSASIRSAIIRSRAAAIPSAFTGARTGAAAVARVAGFQLGAPVAIAEVPRLYYDDIAFARFGPGLYCGNARGSRVVRDPKTGKRRRVALPARRICSFAPRSYVAVRVTYLPR